MKQYFDAISIIAELLNESNEEEVSSDDIAQQTDLFNDEMQKQGLHSKNKSKKDDKKLRDKSYKQQKEEDEEEEEISDTDDSEEEDDEETEKDYKINLVDAVDFDKFISLLNKFRAAHSFSDGSINDELQSYFSRLSDDEKKTLHVFFKALIQITLMDVKGKAAYVPSDIGFKISKSSSTKDEKNKSKKLKNKLDDDFEDDEEEYTRDKIQNKKKTNKYDFNSPIKIGESKQNKDDILKLLKSI